jgi:Spy/CpxP family protein refolding chaperone
MKSFNVLKQLVILTAAAFCFASFGLGQVMEALQMKELTEKLQLNEKQQQALTPIVAQRDKSLKALKADTSAGKLQKLRKLEAIQANFKASASKVLTPEQSKKLEALQAERRQKLMGS